MSSVILYHERAMWRAEIDEHGHRTYYKTYKTSGPPGLTAEDHLAALPGLPKVGEPYRSDAGDDATALCTGMDKSLDASTYLQSRYFLTFVFSTRPPDPAADVPVFSGGRA